MFNRRLSLGLLAVAFFAAGYGIAGAQGSDEVHLCVKGNGDLRLVVDTLACRPGEQALTWSVGGSSTPTDSGHHVDIFDSNNVKIGPVISTRNTVSRGSLVSNALTVMSLGGRRVFLWVSRDHIDGTGGGPTETGGLQWDGPDCTGRPFLNIGLGGSSLTTPTTVSGPEQTVYAAVDPDHPQAIQGFSAFVETTGRCESDIDGAPYFPSFYVEPVGRLDGMFTPPFKVR